MIKHLNFWLKHPQMDVPYKTAYELQTFSYTIHYDRIVTVVNYHQYIQNIYACDKTK